MKEIKIKLPDDAIAGTVSCVCGGIMGINLKTRNFNFQTKSGTKLIFTDDKEETNND